MKHFRDVSTLIQLSKPYLLTYNLKALQTNKIQNKTKMKDTILQIMQAKLHSLQGLDLITNKVLNAHFSYSDGS